MDTLNARTGSVEPTALQHGDADRLPQNSSGLRIDIALDTPDGYSGNAIDRPHEPAA